jgi:hypothetical protein
VDPPSDLECIPGPCDAGTAGRAIDIIKTGIKGGKDKVTVRIELSGAVPAQLPPGLLELQYGGYLDAVDAGVPGNLALELRLLYSGPAQPISKIFFWDAKTGQFAHVIVPYSVGPKPSEVSFEVPRDLWNRFRYDQWHAGATIQLPDGTYVSDTAVLRCDGR